MPTLKLTSRAIPGLRSRSDGKREVYRDAILPGLYFEVHAGGARTFGVWYRVKGTGRAGRLTLGKYVPAVYDLADARNDARDALHLAHKGLDPSLNKRQKRDAGTVGDLAHTFLEAIKGQVRETTHYEWSLLLEHERLAGLRAMKPPDVTRGDIIRLVDRIYAASISRGGKGYSANRTWEVIRRCFAWAVSKDLLVATPCVGIIPPAKEMPRSRSYSDEELKTLLLALDDEGKMGAAIKLCAFTGVRIRQALGATWSEFDLVGKTWTIPGERAGTKNARAWLTPLADSVVSFLEGLREEARGSTFVLPVRRRKGTGEGPSWRQQSVVETVCAKSGVSDFRPHDLRRTLRTWLAAQRVPKEVRDAILQHVPPRLERTYNLHDYFKEKKAALGRWARHLERIRGASGESNMVVMPFHA